MSGSSPDHQQQEGDEAGSRCHRQPPLPIVNTPEDVFSPGSVCVVVVMVVCLYQWMVFCVVFFLSLPFILDIIMSGLCLWQQQRSEQWSMSSHGCGRGDVQDPLPEVNSEPNWTRGRIKREAAEDVEIDISLSPASYNFVCLNKTIIWVRADFIKVKTQRRKHIVQTTVSSRLAASAWHNLYFRPHATSGMLQIVHNSSPALSRVFSRKCVRWNNSVKHRLQKSSVIGFFFRLMIEIKFRLRFFECVFTSPANEVFV